MRKKHHSNVIFRVALILFCLVLFTAHLSSGMLAKYKNVGADMKTVRTAQPGFTVTSTQASPVIADDGGATYDFSVTNSGEIAAAYSLVVSLAPDTLTADEAAHAFSNVKLDGVAGTYDSSSGSYVFADLGAFEPGDSATHTLTFDTNDFAVVSDSVTNSDNSYKDITVLISAKTVQID